MEPIFVQAMPEQPERLEALLASLEAAVASKNRDRAIELERTILTHVASDAVVCASLERRVQALMADLDLPSVTQPVDDREIFALERNLSREKANGVVYPVWFGTNRALAADGINRRPNQSNASA